MAIHPVSRGRFGAVDAPKDVGDRQLDALLERLDRLTAEVHGLNRRLDSGENLAPVVRELAMLNESLQTLAYAALGPVRPAGAAAPTSGLARAQLVDAAVEGDRVELAVRVLAER